MGAAETDKDYGGENEKTKRLIKKFIRLPKCLKDMLDNLKMKTQTTTDMIGAFGFIHLGSQSFLVAADRANPYVPILTRVRSVLVYRKNQLKE